jgi:pSer/pThr/pTyr-binding forkhead associated (FHA) protein
MDILLLILRFALAGLLYVFLGAVLVMLWRDLQKSATEQSAAQPKGRLVIVERATDETREQPDGSVFPLQPVTSIGRSPTNTVVIPDSYASSYHALLTWRESHWWLEDRDSRNGTTLNGKRVDAPMLVTAGDQITIGETKLRLEIDDR